MKYFFSFIALFMLTFQGQSQSTYNFNQLNYNALVINPAYAGQVDALSAQISYTGLVSGSSLIGAPQLYNVSVHNKLANPDWGLGGIVEIDKFRDRASVAIQPALSRYFAIGETGRLAIGLQGRLQFIDFDLALNPQVPDDIFLVNAGLGLFYTNRHFFLGLSAPIVAQANTSTREFGSSQIGEKPIYIHTGYWFQLTPLIKIKAVVLGNRTSFFEFPISSNQALITKTEWGLNLNTIFSDRYWFGIGYGQVQNDDASDFADYNYINFSAVYSFNIARLSYAYQQLLGNQNLSTNTKHTILLEFDIKDGGREKIVRYF